MKFKDITEEMNALYERKNHDYGNSFSETFRKLGIISAATRMLDKMNRIVSLVTKDQQKVNDMTIMEIDKKKERI